ncbi:hypothetical protein BD289DRAFT_440513 [Coniella lustricola]|uniref:Secreted protein n=1 Tax=Coniella lustricola TaxID=2025994 RepID=A0A2T3A0G1_9PEZI|nr:hypothetical protein BD289DRAFT_440513 [Coniella lustricola]
MRSLSSCWRFIMSCVSSMSLATFSSRRWKRRPSMRIWRSALGGRPGPWCWGVGDCWTARPCCSAALAVLATCCWCRAASVGSMLAVWAWAWAWGQSSGAEAEPEAMASGARR